MNAHANTHNTTCLSHICTYWQIEIELLTDRLKDKFPPLYLAHSMLLKAYDVTAILLGCTQARPTLSLIDSYAYTQPQVQTPQAQGVYKQSGYGAGSAGYSAGNTAYSAGNTGYSAGNLHQAPQRYSQSAVHAQQQGYMPANQPGYMPTQQQGYSSTAYKTDPSTYAQPKHAGTYRSEPSFDQSLGNNMMGEHVTAETMNVQQSALHGLSTANRGTHMYDHASSLAASRVTDAQQVYGDDLDVEERAVLPPSALAEGVEDVANGAWD
jgi:hypothetical protein